MFCEHLSAGLSCEVDIDECASSPCEFGTCEDLVNRYQCVCAPGYEGTDCDVEINECTRYRPCENDAICMDLIADYDCVCTGEFGGKNCSVALIGCEGNECKNGATCRPFYNEASDQHSLICICVAGFRGVSCEISTTATFREDSYIMHAGTRDVTNLDVTLSFRTSLSNGVLLFNLANDGSKYLILSLKGGNMLELEYLNSFIDEDLKLQTDNQVCDVTDCSRDCIDQAVRSCIV